MFEQLCIDGMGSATNDVPEFVPIVHTQTAPEMSTVIEMCREWKFDDDAELQNIVLKLWHEVKYHDNILCSISGGYDSDIISPKCCDFAKKDPAHKYLATGDFDMNCVGVRKAERGARATAYTSCFDFGNCSADQFRPLFWMTDQQKDAYRKFFGIVRFDCYEVWGMKRTGCACCPFGKAFEQELNLAEKYEPKLFRAAQGIFKESYDYTRRFMEFRKGEK